MTRVQGLITAEEAAQKRSDVLDNILSIGSGAAAAAASPGAGLAAAYRGTPIAIVAPGTAAPAGPAVAKVKVGHLKWNKTMVLVDYNNDRLLISTADGNKEKRKIPLKGNAVTVAPGKDNGRNVFEFTVTVGKTKSVFVADSQEDRDEWMSMFA